MSGMMNDGGSMIWGGIVVTLLIVLAIAALVKYVILTK